jgi:hypothetical protein
MPVGRGNFKGERLYSPEFVRRVWLRRMQQEGIETMVKDRKHQINREMWIGATFALGLMQAGNPPIYCGPGVPGDSPDVFGISMHHDGIGQVASMHHWEITEYNEHSSAADVVDHLIQAKMWKSYGPEFSVVCYVRRPGQKLTPHDAHTRLAAYMKGKSYPAAWVLAAVEGADNGIHHVIAQLWPSVSANSFVPEEVERTLAKDMKEILKPSFGLGSGFTPLGKEEVRGWEDN